MKEKYLGDGLYARYLDGNGMITLYTHRETGEHWVALDPEVFDALLQFAKEIGWLEQGQILK